MTASEASSQPPRTGVRTTAWSLPSRAVAMFSGPVGFAVKLLLLSIVNAVGIWALVVLAHRHQWTAAGFVFVVTAAIDALYLVPGRAIPAKFLIPGTFFLIAFQVIPVAYTIDVAFTNYSTGHILKKPSAIRQICLSSNDSTTGARSRMTTTRTSPREAPPSRR